MNNYLKKINSILRTKEEEEMVINFLKFIIKPTDNMNSIYKSSFERGVGYLTIEELLYYVTVKLNYKCIKDISGYRINGVININNTKLLLNYIIIRKDIFEETYFRPMLRSEIYNETRVLMNLPLFFFYKIYKEFNIYNIKHNTKKDLETYLKDFIIENKEYIKIGSLYE